MTQGTDIAQIKKLSESMAHFGRAFLAMSEAFSEEITKLSAKDSSSPAESTSQPQVASQGSTAASGKAKASRSPKAKSETQAPSMPESQAAETTSTQPAAPALDSKALETPPPEAKQEQAAQKITEDELRNKLVQYSQKHNKEAAYAILAKYDGAKRVNELQPENMIKVFNDLSAGL